MPVVKTPYANAFAFLNSDEDEAQLVERVSALLNGNGTQKKTTGNGKKERQLKVAANWNGTQRRPDAQQNLAFGERQRRNNGFQRQRPPYNNPSQRNPNGGYQQWVKKDEENEMKAPSEKGSDDSWQQGKGRRDHGYYQGRGRGGGGGKGANFRPFGKGNHNQQQSEFTSSGKNVSFGGDGGKPHAALEALKNTSQSQERVVDPADDGYNMKVVGEKKSQEENKNKKHVRTFDDFLNSAPKGRSIRNNKKHMEVPPHNITQELEQVSLVLDLNGSDFPLLRAPQRA